MKKYLVFSTLALLAMLIAAACKKELIYNPTAYTVPLPAWAPGNIPAMHVPVDNPLTVEGIALGRKLFYEKKLSNDFTMACATCHKQENAFDDPRRFSQGTNGAFGDRNAMAIVNLAWDEDFFWDGRRSSLEGQAHDPVTNPIEMRMDWPTVVQRLQADPEYPNLFFYAFGTSIIDSTLVTKAIAQFERTLVSFNSPFDRYFFAGDTNALTAQEKRGLDIFNQNFCGTCHSEPTFSGHGFFANNGLDDVFADSGRAKVTHLPQDLGLFKVPTLRNIGVTAPYMHDGRFATLEEVVQHYDRDVRSHSPNLHNHMIPYLGGLVLSLQDKADLVAFLNALTDTEFLTNPNFADPG